MRKTLILFLAVSLLFFSCKNNKTNSNSTDGNNTTVNQNDEPDDVNTANSGDVLELQYLPDILMSYNMDLYYKLVQYMDMFNSNITSEEKVLEVLNMRDSLINEMYTVMEEYFYQEGENDWDKWMLVDKELDTIGFWTVYAEGMLVDIDIAPILEDEIEQYTSDEFKVYMKFKTKYAESMGGEYPFMYVSGYFEAIVEGENMYKNYQGSKYFDQIYNSYKYCLSIVTDMHKVNFSETSSDCFYGDLNYSFYPFATTCNDLETIVENYPNSIFTPTLQKIQENMSTIEVDMDNDAIKSEVFAIVIDKFDNYDFATDKIFEYLHHGQDIVHALSVKNNKDEIEIYTCYRFYSDNNTAQEQMQNIINEFPRAKIIHLILEDEFDAPRIVD